MGERVLFRHLWLVVALVCQDSSVFEARAMTAEEFFATYATATKRLESLYCQSRLVATYINRDTDATNLDSGKRRELTVLSNRNMFRIEGTPAVSDLVTGRRSTGVAVAHPARCFGARKLPDRNDWALDRLFPSMTDDEYVSFVSVMRSTHRVPWIPFSVTAVSVLDFLRLTDPKIWVTGIEESSKGSEKYTRVSYRNTPGGTGWFEFWSSRAWILTGYHLRGKSGDMRASIEYSGERDGIPLLSKAEFWWEKPPSPARTKIETYLVKAAVFAPVPESEFTLESLGIVLPEPASRARRFWICLGLGVLLLGVAYFIARGRGTGRQQRSDDSIK